MHHGAQQKRRHIDLNYKKITYWTLHEDEGIDTTPAPQLLADETKKSPIFFLLHPLQGQYLFSTICCRTDRYIVVHILLHPFHRMNV